MEIGGAAGSCHACLKPWGEGEVWTNAGIVGEKVLLSLCRDLRWRWGGGGATGGGHPYAVG